MAACVIDPDLLVTSIDAERLDDGHILLTIYGNTDFSFYFNNGKHLRDRTRECIERIRSGTTRFHLFGDEDEDDTHNTCTDDCVVLQQFGLCVSLTDNSLHSSYTTAPDLIRMLEEELARFAEEDCFSEEDSESDSTEFESAAADPDSVQFDPDSVQFDPAAATKALETALGESDPGSSDSESSSDHQEPLASTHYETKSGVTVMNVATIQGTAAVRVFSWKNRTGMQYLLEFQPRGTPVGGLSGPALKIPSHGVMLRDSPIPTLEYALDRLTGLNRLVAGCKGNLAPNMSSFELTSTYEGVGTRLIFQLVDRHMQQKIAKRCGFPSQPVVEVCYGGYGHLRLRFLIVDLIRALAHVLSSVKDQTDDAWHYIEN